MKNLTRTICLTLVVLLGNLVFAPVQGSDSATALDEFGNKIALKVNTFLAEQGDVGAQFTLGLMYSFGYGVPQDHKTALKWYTLAAEQGHADAQNNLALMYNNGQGVPQDYKTALKWWTLAVQQGSADAPAALGASYRDGQGVPQNNIYAYMWFNIAVSKGYPGIRRDLVAKEMTATQIERAQDLARQCVAKKYKVCDVGIATAVVEDEGVSESSLPPCIGTQRRRFHNCHSSHKFSWGAKYVGEWKNGKKHGKGTFTYASGGEFAGEWKNGSQWEGTLYDDDGDVAAIFSEGAGKSVN